MASRDYIRHIESVSSPTSGRLGDEWVDQSTNTLHKRIALDGKTVSDVPVLISNNGNVSINSPTLLFTISNPNRSGALALSVAGTERMRIDNSGALQANGSISDQQGNVRDLVNNAQSGAYVLTAADNGKMVNITTGGVTVNISIFSAGNNVTIFNNSAVSQTITQGASVTMYLAGTATTGNRTLAQRGIATIVCVAANTFVISGSGLS